MLVAVRQVKEASLFGAAASDRLIRLLHSPTVLATVAATTAAAAAAATAAATTAAAAAAATGNAICSYAVYEAPSSTRETLSPQTVGFTLTGTQTLTTLIAERRSLKMATKANSTENRLRRRHCYSQAPLPQKFLYFFLLDD